MIRRIITPILTCLIMLTSFSASSQAVLDTLHELMTREMVDTIRLELLQKVIWKNHRDDFEKALLYADSAMALCKRIDSEKGIIANYYYYGVIYKNTGQYEKALGYLNQYMDYARSTNDEKSIADGSYQLAIVKEYQGNLESSLEYYQQALRIYGELDNSNSVGFTLNAMGSIYKKMKQFEKAISIYEEAISLHKENGNLLEMGYSYNNIGSIYGRQGQFDTSLVYFTKYLDIAREVDSDFEKGGALENIGRVYQGKKMYKRALDYFQQSLDIREKLGHYRPLSTTLSAIAIVQISLKQYPAAIRSLNRGLQLAEERKLKPEVQRALNGLAKAYKASGDYQKALDYHERYASLKDSLLNDKITGQIAEMDARFETSNKEKEIALLSSQNQIQELSLDKAQRQNLLVGLGLFAALAIASLLFYFFRQKQKDNAIITDALKEKELLLREIHHRVKNNLQVVSSLLDLQSSYIKDEHALQAIKQGRDRVHSMALIHQNLYQDDNLMGVEIQAYFDQLIQRLFHSYNVSPQRIRLETKIEDIHLDVDTLIPLGLIVNELVSNALKHAFPDERIGVVKISLREEQQRLVLEVADDGVGFDKTLEVAMTKSFGYRMINAFKNRLKAELNIHNNHGTQISMRIADYQKVA